MRGTTDLFQTVHKQLVEAASAYAASALLFLQNVNWAMVGGIILFIARASVDIPKAIDYWKERAKKK